MKATHKNLNRAGRKQAKTSSQRVAIAYDREADVLSVTFGRPIKAEAEEIGRGVYARYAQPSGRLAEICIVGFSQRFGKQPQEISVPEYAK